MGARPHDRREARQETTRDPAAKAGRRGTGTGTIAHALHSASAAPLAARFDTTRTLDTSGLDTSGLDTRALDTSALDASCLDASVPRASRRTAWLLGAATFLAAFTGAGLVAPTEAAAETRTLNLYYTHTGKREKITFKKNGRYLKSGLKKANKFLADWRTKEQVKIDPRLLDIVWEVYERSGSRKPVHVISSYRSPKTNAMLRRTRGGQAKKSQHMVGRALDFYLPDVSVKKLRDLGLLAQAGGVGYYPKSGSPFVHLDTGRVRHWPRMSRRELVKVFPKGKTLHVPTDGKPLPGYKTAQANYSKRMKGGGSVVDDGIGRRRGGGLLTALFGGGRDDEPAASGGAAEGAASAPRIARLPSRGPVASVRPGRGAPAIQTLDPAEVAPLPGVDSGPDAPVAADEGAITAVAALAALAEAPVPLFRPDGTAVPGPTGVPGSAVDTDGDGGAPGAVLTAALEGAEGQGELTVASLVTVGEARAATVPTLRGAAEEIAGSPEQADPQRMLRPGDATPATASTGALALAYAPLPDDGPAARALARVSGVTAEDVARRSLRREDELLAAITRGTQAEAARPAPGDGDAPVLTENALRLAFARSSIDVAARRAEVLGNVRAAAVRGTADETVPAASSDVNAGAGLITNASLLPGDRMPIANIGRGKIDALAAALRRQAEGG